MSNNLHTLMKEIQPQYAVGAPILLEACALYEDSTSGLRIAQLKWRNLEAKCVNAVSVVVDFWDSFDQHLSALEHQYIGVNAAQGAIFGTQDAIILQNKMAVRIATQVKAVSFADGTVWSAQDDALFSPLPDAVNLQLPEDLKTQHKRDLKQLGISTVAAQYLPQTHEDLWQCGCGRWQKTSQPACEVCHATKETLLAAADESTISANLCAFEQETNQKAYNAAVAQMNNASNERAYLAVALKFEALGDFSDAQEMTQKCRIKADEIVKDSIYSEAMSYHQSDLSYKQAKAAELFKKIPGWKDADELAEQCKEKKFKLIREEEQARQREVKLQKKKKRNRIIAFVLAVVLAFSGWYTYTELLPQWRYNSAIEKMNLGQYEEAIATFTALGEYEDAAEKVKECTSLKAHTYVHQGKIEEAKTLFTALGSYSDASLMVKYCDIRIKEKAVQYVSDALNVAALYDAYPDWLDCATRADKMRQLVYDTAEGLLEDKEYKRAADIFEKLGTYSDASVRTTECRNLQYAEEYDAALAALNAGNYDEAIAAFDALGTYSDAADKKAESQQQKNQTAYNAAMELLNNKQYDAAASAFEALGDFSDSATMELESRYQKAKDFSEIEKFEEAYDIFTALNNYKDSADKAVLMYQNQLKAIPAGGYLTFGAYEQDNNSSNGKEDIEWLVLKKEKERMLVVSKYALDYRQYDEDDTGVTWKYSAIRQWLNESFLYNAFSSQEKSLILQTVVTDTNNESNFDQGEASQDFVFLLSLNEVKMYFSSNDTRKCTPTQYAKSKVPFSSYGYDWWLRTKQGLKKQIFTYFRYVDDDGSTHENWTSSDWTYFIRPALWIDVGN